MMSCRSTLPLCHNVGRFLALSDIIHPSTPAIRLHYGLDIRRLIFFLSVCPYSHMHLIINQIRGVILRETTAAPRGGGKGTASDRIDHLSTSTFKL